MEEASSKSFSDHCSSPTESRGDELEFQSAGECSSESETSSCTVDAYEFESCDDSDVSNSETPRKTVSQLAAKLEKTLLHHPQSKVGKGHTSGVIVPSSLPRMVATPLVLLNQGHASPTKIPVLKQRYASAGKTPNSKVASPSKAQRYSIKLGAQSPSGVSDQKAPTASPSAKLVGIRRLKPARSHMQRSQHQLDLKENVFL